MKVDVVLYNTKANQKQSMETLCPNDLRIPEGFKVSGGSRKFIVLVGNESMVVAIGELLCGNYYYHKDILKLAQRDFPDTKISGGGQVDFEMGQRPVWHAKFSGSSGDFGVFDKVLLEDHVAYEVAKAMKMDMHAKTEVSCYANYRS